MKYLNRLFLALSLMGGSSAFASEVNCADLLADNTDVEYQFGALRELEGIGASSSGRSVKKGLFVHLAKKGAFPTLSERSKIFRKTLRTQSPELEKRDIESGIDEIESDMIRAYKLDRQTSTKVFYKRLTGFLAESIETDPSLLLVLRNPIAEQALLFFRHRMRPPTLDELSQALRFPDTRVLKSILDIPGFWKGVVKSDLGRHIEFARKRVVTAYARAVRQQDISANFRTRRIAPTTRQLAQVMSLIRSNEHYQWRVLNGDYGAFKLWKKNGELDREASKRMLDRLTYELEGMLGRDRIARSSSNVSWVFQMPALFPEGMEQLQRLAQKEYPSSFTSFEDRQKFNSTMSEKIRDLVADRPGFLVSSFKPGREIDWRLLAGMKKMAADRGYGVILIPEDGMFQDIHPDLIRDPDIHILPDSIENSELLLSNFPSNDRGDPLGPFKRESGMYKIGQQIILPHATLAHESIPSRENGENQTQLYTTGTINLPRIGAVGRSQKAKAKRTAKGMKRSYLVVEKVDQGRHAEFGGVGNHWHIRPVEALSDGQKIEIVDRVDRYVVRNRKKAPVVSRTDAKVNTIYFSDLHSIVADPQVLEATLEYMKRMIPEGQRFQIMLPDPLDGRAINHHVERKQKNRPALRKLLESRWTYLNRELNDLVGNLNAIQRFFPQAEIVLQASNHSDWIDKDLRNNPTLLQEIVNGDLISEIETALRLNPSWTALEYLVVHRREFLKQGSLDRSERGFRQLVFVDHPERVRVARLGDPILAASDRPDYRWSIHHHGDRGNNGARSSFKAHEQGEHRNMTGDAHRMGYMGRGTGMWIGVGSMMNFGADYTRGGYSSWGVGLGVIYENGSGTLVQFDPYSKSFGQRAEVGVLDREGFFGDPLKVVEDSDNDRARIEIEEEEWISSMERSHYLK